MDTQRKERLGTIILEQLASDAKHAARQHSGKQHPIALKLKKENEESLLPHLKDNINAYDRILEGLDAV